MRIFQKPHLPEDPLQEHSLLWSDFKFRIMHSILYKYGNELPLSVSKCFIKVFQPSILSGFNLRPEFCDKFQRMKYNTRFVFEPIRVNEQLTHRVRFCSVKLYNIKENKYNAFLEENQEFDGHLWDAHIIHWDEGDEGDPSPGTIMYYSQDVGLMDVVFRSSKTKNLLF